MSKQQPAKRRGRSNKVMVFTCVLALIGAVIVGAIINNATAGKRFQGEIETINKVFSTSKNDNIEQVLGRTVSSGNYAKVEKSLKSYLLDLYHNITEIDELADNEAVYSALEGAYLAKNRDNLNTTVTELDKAEKQLKTLSDQYKVLYNEEGVMTYISQQNLNEEFTSLFKDNARVFYEDEKVKNNYESMLKLLKSSIAVEKEAVDFLNNHKSSWEIKNNQLKFSDTSVSKKYDKILEKVADL